MRKRCIYAGDGRPGGKRVCGLLDCVVSRAKDCEDCQYWKEKPPPVRSAASTAPAAPRTVGASATQSPTPATPAGDCIHFRELAGPERVALGLGLVRRWGLCLAVDKPLGDHVCPCAGCGPTCPKYVEE